ncbi:MAG: threonine synthase [Firmicutes bacterium]|nr:threonine synthase [Bacillota bacterium]MDD3851888.1 threonine synthase [Bacillota bacterium]MDD4708210.1 threonine synthase [Bacillota bacterium]
MYEGLIKRYRRFLDVGEYTRIITLNEGNTPLIRGFGIEERIRKRVRIYLKYEGLNPTGSFKDRGMTMAVTKAVEEGTRCIVCASTGNTSASAAAYAARAGIMCIVLIPDKKIALGKLAQATAYGARVIALDGNFDDALDMVKRLTEDFPVTLVNSINPNRIEGQKTAAFELCDQLGGVPDYLAIPVGNAGNITAYWKGFKEYRRNGVIKSLPAMLGFQAAGAAPIVEGRVIDKPETVATAIRIGNPASWKGAENAAAESRGRIDKVTDEEIMQAYKLLASGEGIFAEPASCASVAGLIKAAGEGLIEEGATVVCVLTGNGLKDPDIAVNTSDKPLQLPADYNLLSAQIADLIGGEENV